MDRGQLVYDIVRVYLVTLGLTFSFFLLVVFFADEFDLLSVGIIWYQLTGLGILLAISYRTANQSDTSMTGVGILFLLWTAFLESLFLIHWGAGRLSGSGGQSIVAGYTVTLLSNIILLIEVVLILSISGALVVTAVILLRMVFATVRSPGRKAILYPVIFGIILADIIGLALLSPPFPDTLPELSTAFVIWLKAMILSPLGLADWVGTHFDLAGVNYYLLWIYIDLVVAWSFTLIDVTATRLKPILKNKR